jgi:hypothetical protein
MGVTSLGGETAYCLDVVELMSCILLLMFSACDHYLCRYLVEIYTAM